MAWFVTALHRIALTAVPGIDAAMIDGAAGELASGGYLAMLAGAFSGMPYKIYAVLAGESGRSLPLFAVMTPLVRLPRLLLSVVATASLGRLLQGRTPTIGLAFLMAFWIGFYAWYFSTIA